jgi:protein SCO1/2
MMKNRQTLFFLITVALFIAGIVIFQLTSPPLIHGSIIDPPKKMPDFTLQSVNGPVSLSDFRGKIVILYFGYTSCPDVCPLTLANIRNALQNLGSAAGDVQVVFVSVDWKRDTPEKVGGYASNFGQNVTGLTGSQAEIDAVTKDFGIFYKINDPESGSTFYTVDHTSTTLVLDRQGRLILTWPYGLTPDQLVDDLKVVVRK